MGINIKELTDSRDTVNKWMERFGVRFGVYKKGIFNEQLFPFDSVPRIIPKKDWDYLERGLEQRVRALNMFLWDIYHEKKIIKDGVVPEEFVYSSKGYMPQCEGISPAGKVYAHIAGIDLVEGKDGQWYVLEDNLRIPSGASYLMMFEPSSLLGIPNVMQAYKAGNVALINAIGNGVADDKGIYYFVPKMVKYYLGEESILQNAPTYLPYFKDLEILEDGELVWRKADLRAFVVTGNETKVWKSGLTRFSRNPDSFVVNSSQGGGFKDTWVMVE